MEFCFQFGTEGMGIPGETRQAKVLTRGQSVVGGDMGSRAQADTAFAWQVVGIVGGSFCQLTQDDKLSSVSEVHSPSVIYQLPGVLLLSLPLMELTRWLLSSLMAPV